MGGRISKRVETGTANRVGVGVLPQIDFNSTGGDVRTNLRTRIQSGLSPSKGSWPCRSRSYSIVFHNQKGSRPDRDEADIWDEQRRSGGLVANAGRCVPQPAFSQPTGISTEAEQLLKASTDFLASKLHISPDTSSSLVRALLKRSCIYACFAHSVHRRLF